MPWAYTSRGFRKRALQAFSMRKRYCALLHFQEGVDRAVDQDGIAEELGDRPMDPAAACRAQVPAISDRMIMGVPQVARVASSA